MGGEGEAANDDALPLTGAAVDADAGAAFAANVDSRGKSELLAGLVPVLAETPEKRPATGDASQNLARAVEMLSQPRAAATDAGKPAVLTHARDPRWADDFSARVSLMVRAGESTASLALTPVDLGPVEVKVTVKDSQATIQFAAAQADTRTSSRVPCRNCASCWPRKASACWTPVSPRGFPDNSSRLSRPRRAAVPVVRPKPRRRQRQ